MINIDLIKKMAKRSNKEITNVRKKSKVFIGNNGKKANTHYATCKLIFINAEK